MARSPLAQSRAAMTRLIDLPTLAALVHDMGAAHFLCELADEIHADFLRWNAFDKTARLASHSPQGVIELMPVSDRRLYSFKYVNGHPGNPAHGLPTVPLGKASDLKSMMKALQNQHAGLVEFETRFLGAHELCQLQNL